MATSKKTTTKKTTVKKSAPKRTAAKKSTKKTRLSGLRAHVALRPEESEFMTFRLTRQTLYWLVLGAVVILFTVWLMKLQSDIQGLYDQIDMATIESSQL